jgi:hypothetical protein
MRDFKGMKRQRSRNRGGGGGGKPQNNANRAFESNGPDGVKIRGAAQHVFEKYQQLARDALTSGDRVLAESYQQHAEHYFRVLRAVQPQRPPSDIMGRDAFSSGFDIDFEDESGGEAAEAQGETVEADGEPRGEWREQGGGRYEARRDDRQRNGYRDDRGGYRDDRPRDDRPRDDRPRDDRPRDDRPRDDRPRDDRPRDDRPRDDRPRDDRPKDDRPRDDRPRDDRPRDDRPRDDRPYRDDRSRGDRNDRFRDERRFERSAERNSDPLAVVEPQAQPLAAPDSSPGSPILRSQDGGVSQAPAFLQVRGEARPETDDGARPRSRRRREPRGDAGSDDAAPPSADAAEDA